MQVHLNHGFGSPPHPLLTEILYGNIIVNFVILYVCDRHLGEMHGLLWNVQIYLYVPIYVDMKGIVSSSVLKDFLLPFGRNVVGVCSAIIF